MDPNELPEGYEWESDYEDYDNPFVSNRRTTIEEEDYETPDEYEQDALAGFKRIRQYYTNIHESITPPYLSEEDYTEEEISDDEELTQHFEY